MNLLLRARRGKGQEDVAAIDAFVHCEPETPRRCQIALALPSGASARGCSATADCHDGTELSRCQGMPFIAIEVF